MNLTLVRNRFYDTHTIGQLYIDGEYFCFTLEDVVREQPGVPVEKWKVKNETAIPYGTYKIEFVNSPKFGENSMWVHDVPGFTGILIHSGNTDKDTSGCIIVGHKLTTLNDKVDIIKPGTTRAAVTDLKEKLLQAKDPISITIKTEDFGSCG